MSTRTCACGCGDTLAGLRADAVYRSESCRKRHEREGRPDRSRTRRLSRDGKGTKVYLTEPELLHLRSARNFQKVASTPLGDRLDAKLNRAIGRVAA